MPRLGLYPAVGLAFLAGLVCMFMVWLWLHGGGTPASAPAPAPSGLAGERAANATIMRALVDMAGLPYEESLAAPLEENVKQADYALVQAMLRLGLRPADTLIEKTELRHGPSTGQPGTNGDAYHFQRLRIPVGDDPRPFTAALRESLQAWAERAELTPIAADSVRSVWSLSIGGVQTHELVLWLTKPGAPVAPVPPELPPRPMPSLRRPGEAARLVLVMDDLGQSMPVVRRLLDLPYPVTFAIWPDSSHAREAALAAHAAGREIIVHQPMEPLGYPKVKPGPGVLLAGADEAFIEEQIRKAFAKVPYAVGLNNHMGSRFTQNGAGVRAVLRVLRAKNMLALDSVTHPASLLYAEGLRQGLPALRRDVFLDVTAKREAVLQQLRKAEKVALLTGHAVAIGHPLPETLAALQEWGRTRNTQVTLVRLADLVPRETR